MGSHGRGAAAGRMTVCAALLLVIMGWAGPGTAWARAPESGPNAIYDIRPPNIFRHNVGLLDLMITNVGVIGNPGLVDQFAARWRGGEYLYAAALWIGAIASDNLPYVSTGAYEFELRPSLDPVDTIYPSYEGAAGGNRPGFSISGDDDNDGKVDEDPLNGKDDDGDGKIDEDYSAISQQMFACEYWDYTDEAKNQYPNHRPLHVKVHQESYAWSSSGMNEFVGFDFRIKNDGFELLRRVYIGFFVDSDVGPRDHAGYYLDDRGAYSSIDTTFTDVSINYSCPQRIGGDILNCAVQKLHMDICYMWDVPDNGQDAKGGDVPGYFGGMFLGHTTDPSGERAPKRVELKTARFFSGGNAYPLGDPTNDTERYDLLQSGAKQIRPTGAPDDFRYCMSAGPFSELAPGEELTFEVAFVIGAGKDEMVKNAVNAQRIYNGKWRDVDHNPNTGVGYRTNDLPAGRETCLKALSASEPVQWKDPCDTLSATPASRTVKDTSCLEANYVDNDCDCCTPLYQTFNEAQTQGFETLVHWVGTVAPPPPTTNISYRNRVPGDTSLAPGKDRKVVIKWDNLSELTADPIQQKILFTGYKVWRVESWKRPVGASGPSPEEWSLIANLSLRPEDSLGVDSPSYLMKFAHNVDTLRIVSTGSTVESEKQKPLFDIGRYVYTDTSGLKNGMVYFYDVTAYSAYTDTSRNSDGTIKGFNPVELNSRPSSTEQDEVVPLWTPTPQLGDIYVVPNPYIRGKNPDGWDLIPSNADPTGTKIAFVGLPADEKCDIRIYTLAGDLVQTIEHDGRAGQPDFGKGAAFWNLISRNGQDIVSGVYIYSVQCGGKSKVGRFVVIR
jgi:hypothetical protein